MPGATVIDQRDDYLYARFETKLLRFVDDAEFWYDPAAQAIQVRSASRLGRKDFGVNWSQALDGGGFVVGDDVDVTIDVELVKK